MAVLEFREGCRGRLGCFGPQDDFVTIFGAELRFLKIPIAAAFAAGATVAVALWVLRRKGILRLPRLAIGAIAILAAAVVFFWLLPATRVVY